MLKTEAAIIFEVFLLKPTFWDFDSFRNTRNFWDTGKIHQKHGKTAKMRKITQVLPNLGLKCGLWCLWSPNFLGKKAPRMMEEKLNTKTSDSLPRFFQPFLSCGTLTELFQFLLAAPLDEKLRPKVHWNMKT